MRRPLLAITMGDPAGVGPETIVGAWADEAVHRRCRAVVLGHPEILRRAVDLLDARKEVVEVASPETAESSTSMIPCLACGPEDVEQVAPAVVDARAGQAAFDAVVLAAQLALAGRVDGMVTAPLNKAALWQAGHRFPGHTELLAELCGVRDFAMMLYLAPGGAVRGRAGLGVVHVTLHTAMRQAIDALSSDAIVVKARLAHDMMRALLGQTAQNDPPRLGVCALNPHGGEQGLFGDEETRIIRPAVERGRSEGLHLTGPLPSDTLMLQAIEGRFDAVVAMYHDQGHIALKLLGMHRAVNVTLGLPIVRTSVAHGTAFDLAWQGKADPGSMVETIRVAAQLLS